LILAGRRDLGDKAVSGEPNLTAEIALMMADPLFPEFLKTVPDDDGDSSPFAAWVKESVPNTSMHRMEHLLPLWRNWKAAAAGGDT
jgi:hypothetical protein